MFRLSVKRSRGLCTLVGLGGLGCSALAVGQTFYPGVCPSMIYAKLPDITILSAIDVPLAATAPSEYYCRVDGTIRTPGVNGGADAFVQFEVALPKRTWNGKYYYEGPGGHFGYFGDYSKGLVKGYAAATGTSGWLGQQNGNAPNIYDASPAYNNPTLLADVGGAGQHAAIVATKAVTAAYYGSPPALSYYDGCSGGGKTGLTEAQKYPADFDGIIAGDAFTDYVGSKMQFVWNAQLALRDQAHYIPASKTQAIADQVYAYCDAKDGLSDGIIEDPRNCAFDPTTLACPASVDGPRCLTPPQVETLRNFYAGPKTSAGVQVAPPEVFGGEAGAAGLQLWLTGTVPPTPDSTGRLAFSTAPNGAPYDWVSADQFFRYLAFYPGRSGYDIRAFNFDTDPATLTFARQTYDTTNPNLSAFAGHGGKLIQYHGWADLAVNPMTAINYWQSVQQAMGSTGSFYRLFMAPSMYHCAGGPGPSSFDALSALENWVEKGVAPTSIVASHLDATGNVDRTRPLCSYPQVGRYKGSGSIDDASSFACVNP